MPTGILADLAAPAGPIVADRLRLLAMLIAGAIATGITCAEAPRPAPLVPCPAGSCQYRSSLAGTLAQAALQPGKPANLTTWSTARDVCVARRQLITARTTPLATHIGDSDLGRLGGPASQNATAASHSYAEKDDLRAADGPQVTVASRAESAIWLQRCGVSLTACDRQLLQAQAVGCGHGPRAATGPRTMLRTCLPRRAVRIDSVSRSGSPGFNWRVLGARVVSLRRVTPRPTINDVITR
jgi:hypothetical protein